MDARSTGSKRSNEDRQFSDRQQRQKRDKYTSVACNDCKKRKIKCSGGTTCQRCENLGLRCTYVHSQTATSSGNDSTPVVLEKLQDLEARFDRFESQLHQIYNMFSTIQAQSSNSSESFVSIPAQLSGQALPTKIDSLGSDANIRAKRHQKPQFEGPASSAYSFSVAKSTLERMGVQPDSDHSNQEPESIVNSPRPSPRPQPQTLQSVLDPLQQIGLDEALRLLSVYEEELDGIYPFINVVEMVDFVHVFYEQFQNPSLSRQRLQDGTPKLDARDIDILRMIFAQVLTLEGFGSSALAERLVESVDAAIVRRLRIMRADMKDVKIWVLQSIYYFHCDEELVAWRIIGFAVRLALEMGLHRTESVFKRFPDPEERSWAARVFWSIYVLDRRWSFGTGMPFALQQEDIDPDLPEPKNDSSPYLQQMVAYGRINTQVWKAVNGPAASSTKAQKDQSAYLDFQVQRWQESTSPELKLIHPKMHDGVQIQPRSLQRLRALLYLRANQMRILISRHHLLKATNINEDRVAAQSVVDIAKDTIQVLVHLHRTSSIYYTQQVCFNYFLVSALATLFLAVCHAPNFFAEPCRAEFYLALDLVKGFSAKSLISQRLWKTVRDLQHIGPKLGLNPSSENDTAMPTPSSLTLDSSMPDSDRPTLAWNSNTTWPHQENQDWAPSYGASEIGSRMSYALTDLFEFAGGNVNRLEDARLTDATNGTQGGSMVTHYPLENDETVSRLLGALISCDNPHYV